MGNYMKIIVFMIASLATPVAGQSFSCRFGQPACLDYGDTICSNLGKCVDSNAVCFERYQCDFHGFTCKSNVLDCVEKHDALVRKHNTLVDDFNSLQDDLNSLQDDYEQSIELARAVVAELNAVETCLLNAVTLADAVLCVP